ncbi:MAG TPA: DUF3662 and FHA domain-containing protein [Miltoncostaeaceae bacterium]|nr:DUF3662 and FHA domain-containing protein [Miltoncostaeaceae bacterium]
MGIFRGIEQRIEGVVERGFRRAFRSSLQPVELARKLAREMDDHKTISVQRVYAPNEFTIYLAPADREGFSSYEHALVTELATYLEAHARNEGLSLVAPAVVALETDADLRAGEFGIACRMAEIPVGAEPVAAPAAAPAAAPPAAAPVVPPPAAANPALAGVSGTQVISAVDAREAGLAPETLTLVMGNDRIRISTRVTTLGRSRDCDVMVPDPNASRVHAEIRHIGMDYHIVDLDSTNGTEVNGQTVSRHALADGDRIMMGTTEIRVELR